MVRDKIVRIRFIHPLCFIYFWMTMIFGESGMTQTDPVVLNGVSVPSDFPFVNITVNDNPDTGRIFINTSWGSSPHYSMILDNTGTPVWYMRSLDNRQDLKVQPDGRITYLRDPGFYGRFFVAMDTTYTVVDTFRAPEGYYTDEHDLQVLPNGHYLIVGKKDSIIDMSQIVPGGHPECEVRGNYLIEINTRDEPVFIWSSFEHFNIEDAVHENLRSRAIDYVHMNAIAVDLDGHYLISSRHLSEITKINRHTREIMWRLGGAHDDFTWINDDHRISYQHDIRVLPNGNYTVMDNGNHRSPRFSRALEFSVDTMNWTVTKVWEYAEADICTWWMGNVQRLPNGNTLINWADNSLPKLTEVRPDGSKAFELDFVQSHASHRTFRFPWKGNAAVPCLIIEPWPDHVTLLFNKFGDPDVHHYKIYGGTRPHPVQVIATSVDPFIHLSSELDNHRLYYFRVSAVDSQGRESSSSEEQTIPVNLSLPGENMVANGDFTEGFDHWNLWTAANGEAECAVEHGELHVQIQESGTETWHIQVLQPNIPLIQGRSYLLEFDAYADAGRIIELEVSKNESPWTNYSQMGYIWLTAQKTHHTHQFVMEESSEANARIEIDTGGSNQNVFIDNVSLKLIDSGVPDQTRTNPDVFALFPNYPNPFNSMTLICFTLAEQSHVQLRIYNMRGREVKSVNGLRSAGLHEIPFHAEGLPSGLYFCHLDVHATDSDRSFRQTRKMLLMK